MVTYTEIYNQNSGIKDISASRFFYLVECKGMSWNKKRNKRKSNFMNCSKIRNKKSHNEYIVFNPNNFQTDY